VKATQRFTVIVAVFVVWVATGCSSGQTSEVQDDIPARLEAVAAAAGPPAYFLGQSYDGIELTTVYPEGTDSTVTDAGAFFTYGTCELPSGDDGDVVSRYRCRTIR
jgi:hypothetical protein